MKALRRWRTWQTRSDYTHWKWLCAFRQWMKKWWEEQAKFWWQSHYHYAEGTFTQRGIGLIYNIQYFVVAYPSFLRVSFSQFVECYKCHHPWYVPEKAGRISLGFRRVNSTVWTILKNWGVLTSLSNYCIDSNGDNNLTRRLTRKRTNENDNNGGVRAWIPRRQSRGAGFLSWD